MSDIITVSQGFFQNDAVTPETVSDLTSTLNAALANIATATGSATSATASATAAATSATAAGNSATAAASSASAAATSATGASSSASSASASATSAGTQATSASGSATSAANSASSATSQATAASSSATAASNSATAAATSASAAAMSAASLTSTMSVSTSFLVGTGPLSGQPYQFQSAIGFDPSAAGASGTIYRKNIVTTTLTYSTQDSTNTWEGLVSNVLLNGPHAANGEINALHGFLQINTGAVMAQGESLEGSATNSGSVGTWDGELTLFTNNSTATAQTLNGNYSQLNNANTTPGSIGRWIGFAHGPMLGGGAVPSAYFAFNNSDSAASITTSGGVVIGGTSTAQASGPGTLLINGVDNSSGTYALTVKSLSGANSLLVNNAGDVTVPNDLTVTNGTTVGSLNVSPGGTIKSNALPLFRGLINGLITSRNGTTPNTKIDISVGAAMDEVSQAGFMASNSVLTVNTGTTGANGLDTGTLAASSWYHVHLIGKPDGTVAGFISLSLTPTLPTGYTMRRRIASVRTDASVHFLDYSQNGDEFLWAAVVADMAAVAVGLSAQTPTLTVPTGVKVNALFNAEAVSNTAGILTLFNSLDQTSVTANGTSGNFQLFVSVATLAAVAALNIRTDTLARVRVVGSSNVATNAVSVATYGWIDTRGRLA